LTTITRAGQANQANFLEKQAFSAKHYIWNTVLA
jgi:hypothetical protein